MATVSVPEIVQYIYMWPIQQSFHPPLEFECVRTDLLTLISRSCRIQHFSLPTILSFYILSCRKLQEQDRHHISCCFWCSLKTVSSTLGGCIDTDSYLTNKLVNHKWHKLGSNKNSQVSLKHHLTVEFCHKIPNITNLQNNQNRKRQDIYF